MDDYFDAQPARDRLRMWMAASGLTQEEAACALGLPLRTLSRVLGPIQLLRWDAADRVAVALGTHPSQLWPSWFDFRGQSTCSREEAS